MQTFRLAGPVKNKLCPHITYRAGLYAYAQIDARFNLAGHGCSPNLKPNVKIVLSRDGARTWAPRAAPSRSTAPTRLVDGAAARDNIATVLGGRRGKSHPETGFP